MVSYTIRFPDELYARLKQEAQRAHRSISAQILYILETTLPPQTERPEQKPVEEEPHPP